LATKPVPVVRCLAPFELGFRPVQIITSLPHSISNHGRRQRSVSTERLLYRRCKNLLLFNPTYVLNTQGWGVNHMIFLRVGRFGMVVALATALAACGDAKLACSDVVVQDTVAAIARQQIEKNIAFTALIDSQGTKISLEAIRTRTSDTKQAECAAHIAYDFLFHPQNGKTLDMNPEVSRMKKNMEDQAGSDITYVAERTDNGKDIYVTVKGLTDF
jgi:hypothetical protein